MSILRLCLAVLLSTLTLTSAGSQSASSIAFRGVTVVDVTGGPSRLDQTVLISGNRIVAVGASRDVRVPKGSRIVDARGKYLIPGLWDLHTHVTMFGRSALTLLLANGVTGIRDMGAVRFAHAKAWRDSIAQDLILGPRMRIASPVVENPNWLRFARESYEKTGASTEWARERFGPSTADEAARFVDSVVALGADHIKVRNWPAAPVAEALVARARERGIPVVGHANLPFPRVGVSSFEHAVFPSHTANPAMIDTLFRTWADSGTAYVPTLVTWSSREIPLDTLRAKLDRARTPIYRYVRTAQLEEWRKVYEARRFESPIDWTAVIEADKRNLKRLKSLGVQILTGTDPAIPTAIPGFAMHDELAELVRLADMTPHEALAAATIGPARFLRVADSLGTVAPGNVADLVLLDADPLADINNVRRIHAVIANGRLLDRATLDRLLAVVERDAR
jgi:imidazolonepropionase-like amidohydrolase